MFLTLVKLLEKIIFYKVKSEPQARMTFSDIGRMTDLSENVGICRKMSENDDFDDFVDLACRGDL